MEYTASGNSKENFLMRLQMKNGRCKRLKKEVGTIEEQRCGLQSESESSMKN